MSIHLRIFFSTLAILFVCGCGNNNDEATTEKAEAYASQADNNTLRSQKFGITINKPEGWHALGFEELNTLVDVGGDISTAGNDELNAVVEASMKNTYSLFAVSQYETGAPVEENPSVFAMAENISHAPGIKRGKDYFFHAKKLMGQANPNYVFEEGYQTRMIDGVTFDQMDLTIEMVGASAKQSYYAAKHGDFIISIIQTYMTDEGEAMTSELIDTIKLDW